MQYLLYPEVGTTANATADADDPLPLPPNLCLSAFPVADSGALSHSSLSPLKWAPQQVPQLGAASTSPCCHRQLLAAAPTTAGSLNHSPLQAGATAGAATAAAALRRLIMPAAVTCNGALSVVHSPLRRLSEL